MRQRHVTTPDIDVPGATFFIPVRGSRSRIECTVCGRQGLNIEPERGRWNYGCVLGHHSCARCGLIMAHTKTGKARRTHPGCRGSTSG